MEKIKLEMNFKDVEGKNFRLSVDEPKADLDPNSIKEVCDLILQEKVFRTERGYLQKLAEVNKVTTTTEEIVF